MVAGRPRESHPWTRSGQVSDGRAARAGWVAPLFGEVQEARELPDGYALRFPGDETWAARLLAFIAAERACCPFFTFALVFEPGQGPLWLQLHGPGGTKEVVAGMLPEVAERRTA